MMSMRGWRPSGAAMSLDPGSLDLGVSLLAAAALVMAAFVAGFVDAIAGGGGLITVPALLLAASACGSDRDQQAARHVRGGVLDLQFLPRRAD